MKRWPSSYEVSIEAFRTLTAAEADGAATRTRVLERAGGHSRVGSRRVAVGALGTVLISLSAAAAWNAFPADWHAPRAQRLDTPHELVFESLGRGHLQPVRIIPTVVGGDTATPEYAAGNEASVYGRAHRQHFVEGAPGRALAAWNDYLRIYPGGLFAPEARYNRALCLIRLGQWAEAKRVLHAFTRVGGDGYRRADAQRLLDWIHARPSGDEAP